MLSALAPRSQSERVCAKGVLTGTSISSSYKSRLSAVGMGKLSASSGLPHTISPS